MKVALVAAMIGAAALTAGAATAEDKALSWADAFSLRGAPKAVHLQASYLDKRGKSHDLELWRDGDQHLRRRTDDKIDLFVEKTAGGDYAFRLADLANKRLIEVSRTNLYRIGVFADWPALAGIVSEPKGPHALHREARPATRTKAGECRWILLEVKGGDATEICWSDHFKVPLIMEKPKAAGGAATTLFQVKQIDEKRPAAEVFKVATTGLALVRADDDIDPSSDL